MPDVAESGDFHIEAYGTVTNPPCPICAEPFDACQCPTPSKET